MTRKRRDNRGNCTILDVLGEKKLKGELKV
jgi:hypothetical protein